jgi:hypothetical protein
MIDMMGRTSALYATPEAAQEPLTPAPEPELLPNDRTANNGLIMVFLCLAVLLIASGITFLEAYLRDHRSVAAASATRAVRVLPGPNGDLELETEPQAQTNRSHATESKQDISARLMTATEPPQPNAPVINEPPAGQKIPSLRASNGINTSKSGSGAVSRPSPKLIASEVQVPPIPINSNTGSQPSLLAQQWLPKPPEPTKSAMQSAKNTPLQPNAAIRLAPPSRESASRDVPKSTAPAQASGQPRGIQNFGYVPARPLKWATPDARSLGVSQIPQAIDIAVKIRIDDSGRVTSAHALLDGSIHDQAVLAAATAVVKQWMFEPAKLQGKNVASEDTVVIHVDPRR